MGIRCSSIFGSVRVAQSRTQIAAFMAVCVMALAGIGIAAESKAPARGGRAGQIVAEINATYASMPRYGTDTQVDPRYRKQMQGVFGEKNKHVLDLIAELEKVSPHDAIHWRATKCLLLVHQSLYGDADAAKTLTDLSNSATPADAVVGKAGLLATQWWNSGTPAAQQEVVGQFQALAKAHPTDSVLLHIALKMALYLSASDDLSTALRDIVEQDLTSADAMAYKKRPAKIGRPFKLSVRTLNGPTISMADWKGKVILIDFWATWCGPCKASLPGLIKLYQENHAKGLEVLGISNDSSLPELKQFLARNKDMAWPESFGPGGANGWNTISTRMEVKGIPTTFLIDRNGILRDIEIGFSKEDLLKKLLDEQPKPQGVQFIGDPPAGAAPPSATAPKAAATPSEPASPPASADPASESKANGLLSLANGYITAQKMDAARSKLNELIQKYPNTTAAKKAKELLAKLG